MLIERFTLFLDRLEVEAEIGIHDFERGRRQRLHVTISIDVDPSSVPTRDDISATFDYDLVRTLVRRLAAERRYDLQETFCRAILDGLCSEPGIIAASVETKKPDVYPDAAAVGCRLSAKRESGRVEP